METMKLEIITPSGKIFDNQIASVTLPGKDGEFGVLPSHASLVSLLSAGAIEVETADKKVEMVAIDWGYAEIHEEKVTVLVEGAVHISGTTSGEMAKSLEAAKELLNSVKDSNMILASVEARLENSAKGIM